MPESEDQTGRVDRPNVPPSQTQPGISSNPMLRCPLPNIVAPSADNLRQFYGSQVGQYRLLQPLLPASSSTTTIVNRPAAQASSKGGSGAAVTAAAHGPNRAVQVAQAAPNGGFTFDADEGLLYDQFPTGGGLPVTLAVTNIAILAGAGFNGGVENFTGNTANKTLGMLAYVAADNTILYSCGGDSSIRKFSCSTLTVVAKAVVPNAIFGFGASTLVSNVDNGTFAIISPLTSPVTIEIWDAVRLVKLASYGAATFGGTAPNPALRRTITYDSAKQAVWMVEGSGSLVRYNLLTGVRTVVGGVSLADPGVVRKSPVANLLVCASGTSLTTVSTDTDSVVTSGTMPFAEADPDGSTPCGAAWDGDINLDPDGFLWLACNATFFSGHAWKIDPATLTKVARIGEHGTAFSFPPLKPTAVPNNTNCGIAFLSALHYQFALQGGDLYWELALFDRSTITHDPNHGPLLTMMENSGTTPALVGFGHGLDNNLTFQSGVVASIDSLWAFLNNQDSPGTLRITRIQLATAPTLTEKLLVSQNGDLTGSYVLAGRDGNLSATGTVTGGDVEVSGAKAPHVALIGPASGSLAASPTWRALVAADLPPVTGVGGVNVQTTNYTAVSGDTGKVVSMNGTSLTLTLPATPPSATWVIFVENRNASDLTLSPNSLTLDGVAANLIVKQNEGIVIFTDASNYFTERGGTGKVPTARLVSTGAGLSGGGDLSADRTLAASANVLAGIAGITIDGAGGLPSTGSRGFIQIPYSGTVASWTLVADASGSAQITVKKSTYTSFPTTTSIVASAPPNLSAAQKNTSSTLTGWTTAITAGDICEFNLDSVSGSVTRLTLEIQITKS